MDKTALKLFARSAREKLLVAVKQRASRFKITESGIEEIMNLHDLFIIDNSPLNQSVRRQYNELNEELSKRSRKVGYKEAYEELMEEVAYTWFNRLITIRYMEIHDYLPIGMPLLSSSSEGREYPDVITYVNEITNELNLDQDYVWKLQESHDNNELFKYILIQQSHQLGELLPSAFDKLGGIEELLLPDNLLSVDSVIDEMIKGTNSDDWEEVEVIGWLYQYYQSEVKEAVGGLKNIAVSKRYLPTVTQLFTPKWIVRYMLQNSLGKLYDEKYPKSPLVQRLEYYLQREENSILLPNSFNDLEDLKIVDPACGSGHILIEAFDLLYDMYLERGYSPREISKLIIEKNLYGFEIDKRSTQITHICLFLKAVEKNRRIIQRKEKYIFHVFEFQDVFEKITEDNLKIVFNQEEIKKFRLLEDKQENGKQFGSLIKFDDEYTHLYHKLIKFLNEETDDLFLAAAKSDMQKKVLPLIEIAYFMSLKYDVVCTNPPYHNKFNPQLKKFINEYYPDTKSDMYSAFIEKCFKSTKENGYAALMTPMTWMFISTHEKLRKRIINDGTISSLVHMEYSAFEDATVPLCSFVIQNNSLNEFGVYIGLTEFKGGMDVQEYKMRYAAKNNNTDYKYEAYQADFRDIPGMPIAYSATKNIINAFKKYPRISEIAETRLGMATANNDQFLRMWFEVNNHKISFSSKNNMDAKNSGAKWFPYNKGGAYRKWYGNNDYIVNWEKDGLDIRTYSNSKGKVRSHNYNLDYIFKPGITWSALSSGNFSSRCFSSGFLFDNSGSSLFVNNYEDIYYIQGFLSTKIVNSIFPLLNPTLNYQPGTVGMIPIKVCVGNEVKNKVNKIVAVNILYSKTDWDSFEISWDFEKHPFISNETNTDLIENVFQTWEQITEENFNQLKANEEELNRIFIDMYGLQDELIPEVEDRDVTIRKADLERDVKSFLSYLVGVVFGRYSLDEAGLIYAGGAFNPQRYQSYQPDDNNIIPLTHENYFSDDIVTRITDLVTLIYGEETLEDNLLFIAQALNLKGNETPRDAIRRYFIKDFFKDHKKIYQKRPIYWQLSSGKEETFKGIFYLHRYDHATLARVRTEYVLPLTNTLTELSNQMQAIIDGSALSREVATARKSFENYQKQLQELRDYDLILKNLADQHIELDLDDGVKVNYEKFQNILVTNVRTGKPGKMNLLEKL